MKLDTLRELRLIHSIEMALMWESIESVYTLPLRAVKQGEPKGRRGGERVKYTWFQWILSLL